jgi:hypothetical protein
VRSRTLIIAATLGVAAIGGAAAGIAAYDSARADEIGKGVRVGGVPLDGLTAAQAKAKLDRLIIQPLERPIVIHHDTSTWTLGSREARIAVDTDKVVDDALERSREGNVLARTVRGLTGKSLDADVRPRVTFSDRAVVRMLDKIRGAIERKPVDATAKLSGSGIETTGRPGCTARSRPRSSPRPPTAHSSRARARSSRRSPRATSRRGSARRSSWTAARSGSRSTSA